MLLLLFFTMASSFLDLYDPLDIIGNGSFGIIRKVRRKSDGLVSFFLRATTSFLRSTSPGQIFARKELNFERMSERDRKQIVAEVYVGPAFFVRWSTKRLGVQQHFKGFAPRPHRTISRPIR
jgi:hypothetical protein